MRLCVCVFCARCDAQRIMAHEKLFKKSKPKVHYEFKKKISLLLFLKIVCK